MTHQVGPDTRVLVTGGSSGIGLEVARALAARRATPILLGRDETRLEQAAEATGGTAVRADLADPHAVEVAIESVGRVDVLINNAGAGLAMPLSLTTTEDIDRLVNANVTGTMKLTAGLVAPMVERRQGAIVLVSSIAGKLGVRDESVYAGTKAAVDAFGWSLRSELAGSGISVSVVVPGAVRTPFFERRRRPYDRRFPRQVAPERVAAAVLRAVEHGNPEVIVPRWLRLPTAIRAVAPGLFDTLSNRFS